MNKDPMQNPSPSSKTPAYPEHGPNGGPGVMRPSDGSAARAAVAAHGTAQRPAPVLRKGDGTFVPGSGRKQS